MMWVLIWVKLMGCVFILWSRCLRLILFGILVCGMLFFFFRWVMVVVLGWGVWGSLLWLLLLVSVGWVWFGVRVSGVLVCVFG